MENLTAAWAQEYGAVWVIAGPVIVNNKPSGYIGEEGEFKVAIPDALFKIVIKDSTEHPEKPDVLAFLYPQVGPGYDGSVPFSHQDYLVSVDEIEKLTGLDFLTELPDSIQDEIGSEKPQWLWPVSDANFIRACR